MQFQISLRQISGKKFTTLIALCHAGYILSKNFTIEIGQTFVLDVHKTHTLIDTKQTCFMTLIQDNRGESPSEPFTVHSISHHPTNYSLCFNGNFPGEPGLAGVY